MKLGWRFIILFAVGVCVVGIFVRAAAPGIAGKGKLPGYRRLRASVAGAMIGGALSSSFLEPLESRMFALCNWLAGVLVKLGFTKGVSIEWSSLYVVSGWVFVWKAVGAGIGWWLTREKS